MGLVEKKAHCLANGGGRGTAKEEAGSKTKFTATFLLSFLFFSFIDL
jgi:hypothetical protein